MNFKNSGISRILRIFNRFQNFAKIVIFQLSIVLSVSCIFMCVLYSFSLQTDNVCVSTKHVIF